jgi:hypothetical protein
MSCKCDSVQIILPPNTCPDTGTYTASNENLDGFGVYKQTIANNFQFYGITSSDGTIDVNLDGANNVIDLALDAEILAGSFPDATTTIKGKVALSTNAEALAKASTVKVVTPSNFAAMASTTTFAGLVELATIPETQSGDSAVLAVTPAGLLSVTNQLLVTRSVANPPEIEFTTPYAAGQLLVDRSTGSVYYAETTAEGDWSGITMTDGRLSGDVNIDSTAVFKIGGVTIPADSIIGTTGVAGNLRYFGVADFLSSYNNASYTVSTYSTSRAVADSATITLEQLADVVSTLIADLRSNIKPAV